MRRVAPLLGIVLFAMPAMAQSPEVTVDQKVTFNFQDTQFDLVVDAIQMNTKVNIVVSPDLRPETMRVSVSVSKEPLGSLLDKIQKAHKLERTVWCNAIVLHKAGAGPGKEPTAPTGKGARALQKITTVNHVREPLKAVMTRIKARTKVDFYIPARVRLHMRKRDHRVTLRLWRTPTWQLVHHAARACGVTWKLADAQIQFTFDGKDKKGVDPDDVTLKHFDAGKSKATLKGARPVFEIQQLVDQLDDPRTRLGAVRELARIGKQALPKVAQRLRKAAEKDNPNEPVINGCLRVMEQVQDPSEYQAVLRVFSDANQSIEVRRNAGMTLGAIRAPEAVPALVAALDNNWFRISETARKALIRIGKPASKALIEAYETHRKSDSRDHDGLIYRALLILGEIPTKEAKQTLLAALNVKRGQRALAIRHHAAIGLGYTADPGLILPLIKALESEPQFLIAKYITRSLTWITEEQIAVDPPRWKAWWDTKGRRKFADRNTGKDILDGLGGELKPAVDDKGFIDLKKQEAAARIEAAIKELGTPSPSKKKDPKGWETARNVRKKAAVDLEALGKQALPALQTAVKDKENKTLRAWAAYVIRRIERAELDRGE